MANERLVVEGLDELRRELNALAGDNRWTKALGRANKRAVTEAVVPPVRQAAPRLSGDLAASVRGGASARKAELRVGYEKRVPYAGPINFGWPARNIAAQEFIYSTIYGGPVTEDLLDIYVDELDELFSRAFPEGRL